MDFLFELFVGSFMEFFLELYMELMLLIIPEKTPKKRHRNIAVILATIMVLGMLALGIWGLVLLVEGNRWGFLPLSISVGLSLVQIIAGIVLYKKNHG